MTIDRIGSIDPLQPGKKASRTENVQRKADPDSVAVSSEAMEKGELYRALEIASASPDVRADKIAELKRKIDDPAYITETIVNATAEKIMAAFGL
jgi:negative regulator of flagellin synthesis FlgM